MSAPTDLSNNTSGGSYSHISGVGYDGTFEDTRTGRTKDDFGYDDNIGNVGKGY